MSEYVADTHALLWHVLSDQRLSLTARTIFADADSGVHQILIPSIVLIEAVYLAERRRIDSAVLDRLFLLLDTAPANYRVISLDLGVVRRLQTIVRATVPEMPDRIIVATAKLFGLELLTRDSAIAASGVVRVVW